MRFLATVAAMLISAAPAFADHAGDHAGETARAAYSAADAAERLEDYALRDAHFHPPVFEDHRGDNLEELGHAARSLHLSLSDLYRAARFVSGGGPAPEDHRGDPIRESFEQVQSDFYRLQQTYNACAQYTIDRNIHLLYRDIQVTYQRLEWTVLGGEPQ